MASWPRTLPLLVLMSVLAVATVMSHTVRAETYTVSFVAVGLPSGVKARYYLDGMQNGTIQTGETKTLQFTPGPLHTLSVDLVIAGTNGTRYQCTENFWQFGNTGSYTFTYRTQYYLQVASAYGSPSGTSWYEQGSTAYARLANNLTEGPQGVRYVFARWEGDASGQATTSDPIVMDRPKKAVALWLTQYTLRISSDPIEIIQPSTVWYDAGSTAQFSALNGTANTDRRYVFSEWIGDYGGGSPQGSLQMDGPKLITAKYKNQYLLSVTYTPPELAQEEGMPKTSWYDADQTVSLGPIVQLKDISEVERLVFILWRVDNTTQQGTSIDVSMDEAHHVEVVYRTEYHLAVTSTLGETKGSGWYFSGDTARFGVTYGGSDFPVKYTITGWRSSPHTTITKVTTTEAEVVMDHAYVVEAVWNADYSPAWIFLLALGSGAGLVVGIVVIAVKRPGSFRRLFSSFGHGFPRRKVEPPADVIIAPPPLVICRNCGANVASSAEYCQSCGALVAQISGRGVPRLEDLDERVYDYIAKRRGEISLSQASKDLGISVDDLKNSTERLKRKGRLA